jgi:hypothetical protein
MNAWAFVENTEWQGSCRTTFTVTEMASDNHDNLIFKKDSIPRDVVTITLYTKIGFGPTKNDNGCYLTITDPNTTICINDIDFIVTDKNDPGKKHTESAIFIGSGSFSSTYNEWHSVGPWKGMCYVDLKATLVEDVNDTPTSIKVTGKLSAGASEQYDSGGNTSIPGFITRGNISVTLVPIK